MEILYKNNDFVVCIKPQGTPSQPDPSGCLDMSTIIADDLKQNGEKSDIFIVHRLDRSTGGIMVYARNKACAAELSRIIAEKDGFEKHYLAIVSGSPSEKCGSMTDYIFKDSAQKKAFAVKGERKGSKLASLDYEVIKTAFVNDKTFSLVAIKLHTGRFHQIRVQFASRAMPVYADGKYGSREKAPHFALWANKIAFTYKGKEYNFEKAPDFNEAPWNLF